MTLTRRARALARRYWRAEPTAFDKHDTPRVWRRLRYAGTARQCNLCGARLSRFLGAKGESVRPDAICPVCGSVEWYRLAWWFLTNKHPEKLRPGAKVLHVAAEPEIKRRFKKLFGTGYVAFDMDLRRATVMGDLQKLPFTDGSFDLVYCSHVLEHVTDDHLAIRELRRVVKSDGAALIQVPITTETTFGDPSITDPAERFRLFGQSDHVRRYGPDFLEILTTNGWKVHKTTVAELSAELVQRHGLPSHAETLAAGDIFWCLPA